MSSSLICQVCEREDVDAWEGLCGDCRADLQVYGGPRQLDPVELAVCPECKAPAELRDRQVLDSTMGPVEHARVRCITGRHLYLMPTGYLAAATLDEEPRRPEGGTS